MVQGGATLCQLVGLNRESRVIGGEASHGRLEQPLAFRVDEHVDEHIAFEIVHIFGLTAAEERVLREAAHRNIRLLNVCGLSRLRAVSHWY